MDGIAELNPFRYRGYYYDSDIGLYYLINRYYDPATGRFVSDDHIGYILEQSQQVNGCNAYAYCLNNPVMGYDPEGTWDWGAFWRGLGMIVTAIAAVALAVTTFGAGTPIAMAVVSGVTATVLTGVNGVATVIEAGTSYNFVRDGVFQGNETAYNWYAGITEGVAAVGSMLLGAYHTTGQYKAAKYGRKYLGKGYKKAGTTNSGHARYVSKDGLRQMRFDNPHMYKGQMIGKHMNLEYFIGTKPYPYQHVLYSLFKYLIM